MKKLLGLFLICALTLSVFGQKTSRTSQRYYRENSARIDTIENFTDSFVNVKDFDVIGDGVTDDRANINEALQYGKTNGINVFFPQGDYLFKTGTSYYGADMGVKLSSGTGMKIFGEPGTKFTTSLSTLGTGYYIFLFFESFNDLIVEGIEFENTHAVTTNSTIGIYIMNDGDNQIIRNCTFSGFTNAIRLNGMHAGVIENNRFLAPRGHDDASNNAIPAVYINAFSDGVGQNVDIIVRDNYAEGYSGADITATTGKRSMDGFYYGYSNGAIIQDNTCLNFCEEAIYSIGYELYDEDADIRPTIIRGNYIDSSLPTGTTNTQNYGILFDGSNHIVESNYVKSGYGIFSFGVNYNRVAKNNTIRNNKYFPAPGCDTWYPIYAQGYDATGEAPAKDYLIENNEINIDSITLTADLELMRFSDDEHFTIKNNKFYIDTIDRAGFDITIYSFLVDCDSFSYGGESIIGTYDNLVTNVAGNTSIVYNPWETNNFAADAQGDDDYEIIISTITALSAGLTVTFTANTTNTGAATLEITSVGDLDAILKLNDQVLVTGDIEAGQVVMVVFDGTNWQMISQLAQ